MSKSLKTVIPDELSKRDPLSLLWRIIWSLNDKRSHSVRSARQAEMVAGGGEIHAVDDYTSTCIFAISSKFFSAVSIGNRFHSVRKLQQQNKDRGWRLTTISQCRKAHNDTNTKCFLKLTSSVDSTYFVVLNDFYIPYVSVKVSAAATSRSRSRLGLGLKGLVHITVKMWGPPLVRNTFSETNHISCKISSVNKCNKYECTMDHEL